MSPMVRVVDTLQVVVASDASCTDSEQLQRFLSHRDELAFAEIVRRHGPMVHGVARRILGNSTDADDAFQATFFVLARKANTLRSRELVRSWLYGVAVRIAHKVRHQTLQRRIRTMAAAKPEAIPATLPDRDTWAIIEAELAALPDLLRQVFLTCDVGGQSRSQAANTLGWPEGTVAKRLTKARRELAKRLTKRGITLSQSAIVAVLVADASATMPLVLLTETVRQSVAFGFGHGATLSHIQTLAESIMLGMKAKALTMWLGVGVFLTLLGGSLMWANPDSPPRKKNDPPTATPSEQLPAAMNPWKSKETLTFRDWLPGSLAYSADGQLLAIGGTGGQVALHDTRTFKKIWATQLTADYSAVAFHQGTKFIAATIDDGVVLLDRANGAIRHTITEKGSKPTQIASFPSKQTTISATETLASHQIIVGHARGYFVKMWPNDQLDVISTLATNTVAKERAVTDAFAVPLAVDPAGRSAIITGPIDPATKKNVVWAYVAGDYSKGSPGNRLLTGHDGRVVCAAWASDGATAITGDDQGRVLWWNAKTMKEQRRIELTGRIVGVSLTPDGQRAAIAVVQDRRGVLDAYLQEIYVCDSTPTAKSLKPIVTELQSHFGRVHAQVAFRPNGRELAYCFANPLHLNNGQPVLGNVHVLQLDEPEPAGKRPEPKPVKRIWKSRPALSDPEFDLQTLAIAPDGKAFALNSNHRTTFVYNLPEAKRLDTFDGQFPQWKGTDLYTWGGKVTVRDRTTGQINAQHALNKAPTSTTIGAIDPDGKRVLLADSTGVRIHPLDGSAPLQLEGEDEATTRLLPAFDAQGIYWSPDGTKIAGFFPRGDRVIWLGVWDARNGKQLARLKRNDEQWNAGYACMAWLPDGKSLLVGGLKSDAEKNSSVVVLDAATLRISGTAQATITSRDGGADVTALAVAADQRMAALAVQRHTGRGPLTRVLLFDLRTGELVDTLLPDQEVSAITQLAFTPDQRTLLACTGTMPMNRGQKKETLHRVLIWEAEEMGD